MPAAPGARCRRTLAGRGNQRGLAMLCRHTTAVNRQENRPDQHKGHLAVQADWVRRGLYDQLSDGAGRRGRGGSGRCSEGEWPICTRIFRMTSGMRDEQPRWNQSGFWSPQNPGGRGSGRSVESCARKDRPEASQEDCHSMIVASVRVIRDDRDVARAGSRTRPRCAVRADLSCQHS
jgi:hypothetical protein